MFFRSSCAYAEIQEYLGRIPPKIQKFSHFSLVSLSPRTRSRPDAERIRQGEGHMSCPPKTAFERSDLTENPSSEDRVLRQRRKETPDRIPPKRMIIRIDLTAGVYFHFLYYVYVVFIASSTGEVSANSSSPRVYGGFIFPKSCALQCPVCVEFLRHIICGSDIHNALACVLSGIRGEHCTYLLSELKRRVWPLRQRARKLRLNGHRRPGL